MSSRKQKRANTPPTESGQKLVTDDLKVRLKSLVGKASDHKSDYKDGKAEQAIKQSRSRMDNLISLGNNKLEAVRDKTHTFETEREHASDQATLDRAKRLHDDLVTGEKLLADLTMQWELLMEQEVPLALVEEIDKQKLACDKLLKTKDELVQELQAALKARDDQFTKSLQQYAEDIDEKLRLMGIQFKELKITYEDEIENIEKAFLAERHELLKQHRAEIQELQDNRRRLENELYDQRKAKLDDQANQWEEIRKKTAEEFCAMKAELEEMIQRLEISIQSIKAKYHYNYELLEKNNHILKERMNEYEHKKKQQSKMKIRLNEQVRNIKDKYFTTDDNFRKENSQLTEDYRRVTAQYKDLQAKVRHFDVVDAVRYQEVWGMNEETVKEKAGKLLLANQLVTEQQLGLKWVPPTEDLLSQGPRQLGELPHQDALPAEQFGEEQSALFDRVMLTLCDEAGFLVDSRLTFQLDGLERDQQSRVKISAILQLLGVTEDEDVLVLLKYFVKAKSSLDAAATEESAAPLTAAARKALEKANAAEEETDYDLIHPTRAISAISAFLQDRKKSQQRTISDAQVSASAVRQHRAQEEKDFWVRLENIVPEKSLTLWNALEKVMQEYNKTLTQRSTLLSETAYLAQQNEELQALLQHYMQSQVNLELQISPAQAIELQMQVMQ
eukprot:gnl/Hemi2/103_TR32_c0_g1_i1.p1 gnl/Hemi2/103_TR32_c0_g1~~gnl/Hemi2/103_TR32_c0_g1_i1.p1  ORF type:complete len:673 (-),score=279.17 gnl/Hemi2/103_TR32_c0_g1_i1:109-2127(-)